MINNFIYDDVSNAILNANTALNEITKSITSATAKPYFIYAYSLFESTITEITRYYIKAFPHKIDKNISVNKDLFLTSSRSSDIIDTIKTYENTHASHFMNIYIFLSPYRI